MQQPEAYIGGVEEYFTDSDELRMTKPHLSRKNLWRASLNGLPRS
jgi:hypothetical protein